MERPLLSWGLAPAQAAWRRRWQRQLQEPAPGAAGTELVSPAAGQQRARSSQILSVCTGTWPALFACSPLSRNVGTSQLGHEASSAFPQLSCPLMEPGAKHHLLAPGCSEGHWGQVTLSPSGPGSGGSGAGEQRVPQLASPGVLPKSEPCGLQLKRFTVCLGFLLARRCPAFSSCKQSRISQSCPSQQNVR